jgi:threonine/homoserine/homoserine lactone efflux protein
MTYTENLWVFSTLLFGIIIVPGMDMLFVLANTLASGRRVGLAAVAGIMLGGAVHTLFKGLLLAGAAYMVWIGLTLLRSSITVQAIDADVSRSQWTAFRRGAVTCLLNPKAYLFVVAVYPQFLKAGFGPIWSQALVLGAMTVAVQFGVYGGLAFAAGRSRDLLLKSPRATILVGRAAGLLLMAAAAVTVWQGWSTA